MVIVFLQLQKLALAYWCAEQENRKISDSLMDMKIECGGPYIWIYAHSLIIFYDDLNY